MTNKSKNIFMDPNNCHVFITGESPGEGGGGSCAAVISAIAPLGETSRDFTDLKKRIFVG